MPKKKTNKESPPKLQCQNPDCRELKPRTKRYFYESLNPEHNNELCSNFAPICKNCLRKMCFREDGKNVNVEGIMQVLKFINKPFIESEYMKLLNKGGFDLGTYIKNVSFRYKGQTFNDSDKSSGTVKNVKDIKQSNLKIDLDNQDINSLQEKFGYGYKDEEYILFEKKYQNLKSSINLKSTIHEEYFKSFCVNSVLANLAKSKGDLKKAKDLNDMAQQDAKASNMQPKDIDLTNGIDSISEIVEKVEQTSTKAELMGILPAFKEHPKDKVDVVFYLMTNYQRKLKGLPECKYEDLYQFYDKRAKEIEKDMIDNSIIDGDMDE